MTIAPQFADHKVIVGVSGAEFGVRGHVDAYDPATGNALEPAFHTGIPLDAGAVEALRSAGFTSVIAAKLEPGDVPEDEAAGQLANALLSPGPQRSGAGTGRDVRRRSS